jgi:hypothetical protein
MPVSLVTDRPFASSYSPNPKDRKFVPCKDVKEVKKTCPWATITIPYTKDGVDGHMAFKSVSAYSYWISSENK